LRLCIAHNFLEIPGSPFTHSFLTQSRVSRQQTSAKKEKIMPPRSVCLNVFTKGLGEAVRDDGSLIRREEMNIHPIMERRDSAQSGESL
jgi:hypothetical protein